MVTLLCFLFSCVFSIAVGMGGYQGGRLITESLLLMMYPPVDTGTIELVETETGVYESEESSAYEPDPNVLGNAWLGVICLSFFLLMSYVLPTFRWCIDVALLVSILRVVLPQYFSEDKGNRIRAARLAELQQPVLW